MAVQRASAADGDAGDRVPSQHFGRRLDEFWDLVPLRPEGTGFVEGENVAIEYRYADNQLDRLSVLMSDLVRLPAAVIVVNAPAAQVGTQPRRYRLSSLPGLTPLRMPLSPA